jgi:hypothetical protein
MSPWRAWVLFALVCSALVGSAACAQILGFDKGYKETGGSSSGTAANGTGGTGGVAPPVPCATVADCPGQDSVCGTRTCTAGFCGGNYAPAGTPISAQTVGNCQKIVCDGSGNLTLQVDDTNIPNDNNPCNKHLCTNGTPSNPPEASGTPCGTALACDGQGHCAGCTSPADCPGQDTECEARSCTASLCGFIYTAAGTAVTMQTAGDCKKNVCNGMGAVSVVLDSTDVPPSTNPCVLEGCSLGSPTMTNVVAGVACMGAMGDTVCDGNGNCAQCVAATSCPGTDTECQIRTCTANTCGFKDAAAGKVVSTQTPGDCKQNQCNGAGTVVAVTDNMDVPTNGSVCDTASCNNGTPALTPVAAGTSCGAMKTCNGMGSCTGCTVATDCPGTDTECQKRTCGAQGVCGFVYAASGTPISMQTVGDCKENVCNGTGGVATIVDNADVPPAPSQCAVGTCSNGVPGSSPKAAGTACTSGGTECTGTGICGVCIPGAVRVCCTVKSVACCTSPAAREISGRRCDPLFETCGAPPEITPVGGCCCDTTQACSSAGKWPVAACP